ncbi:MAG: DUF1571 domain-containing protein [Planctomycetota bacterium]|nr:MAG: DUF1571 domain-containing protein [Planctomycetota bacterium]
MAVARRHRARVRRTAGRRRASAHPADLARARPREPGAANRVRLAARSRCADRAVRRLAGGVLAVNEHLAHQERRTPPRRRGSPLTYACICLLVGACAARQDTPAAAPSPEPLPKSPTEPAHNAEPGAQLTSPPDPIAADPLGYLEYVERKCSELQAYTIVLTRTERRGLPLFRRLHGPERIQCWFRRRPFSVRMRWLDESVKYGESTYVAGEQNNRVRFVPRHGLFGLPPGVTRIAVSTPVKWGEARYPVTDFGLERLMERILANVRAGGVESEIEYLGLQPLAPGGRLVHRFRVTVPTRVAEAPTTELSIDPRTHLPVASRIFAADGKLEAAYEYSELDTTVTLTDEDFLLDAERKAMRGAATSSDQQPRAGSS